MKDHILPFVSFVVPLFNEEPYILACINSIKCVDYPKDLFEIIVVDNLSTDNSANIARSTTAQILTSNARFVGGVRNFGVKHAKGSVLAFVDSDCLIKPDWLKNGLQLLQNQKAVAVGGHVTLREDPSYFEKYWILEGEKSKTKNRELIGASILVWKEQFLRVGGFDESITSGEDSKLSIHLKQNGCVLISASLSVAHLGFPTSAKEFVRRQIWQSSGYLKNLQQSFRQPVFLIILLYLFFLLVAVWGILTLRPVLCVLATGTAMVLAALLTMKRLNHAQRKVDGITWLLKVYSLDVLYITARSFGVVNSVVTKAIRRGELKSWRS